MLIYDDLAIFLAVARFSSFKAGALKLALPLSTVSRRLAALEAQLGVQLIHRTTRRFRLTGEGEALLSRCQDSFQHVDQALRQLDGDDTLSGSLRITAPTQVVRDFLGGWIMAFAASHPDLQVELVLSNSWVDLLEEGFDLALRVGPLVDSSLVATRLWEIPYALVASEALLHQHGWLRSLHSPDELAHAPGVIARPTTEWKIHDHTGTPRLLRPRPTVQVNDLGLALEAVNAGLGVGYLPLPMLPDNLHIITPAQWRIPARSMHAVLPPTRRIPHRVRCLIDYLRTQHRESGSAQAGHSG